MSSNFLHKKGFERKDFLPFQYYKVLRKNLQNNTSRWDYFEGTISFMVIFPELFS